MVKNRRAVLYTLTMTIFALSILNLAFLISYKESDVSMGVLENVKTDKLLRQNAFVGEAIRKIIIKTTELDFSYETDKIIIKQKLPINNPFGDLNSYSDFLGIFEENIDINYNNKLEFIIKQINSTYIMETDTITSSIETTINHIEIEIDSGLLNITSITWQNFQPGSLTVKIVFKDKQGNALEETKSIDPGSLNKVFLEGDNIKTEITIHKKEVKIHNIQQPVSSAIKINSDHSGYMNLINLYNMSVSGVSATGIVTFI